MDQLALALGLYFVVVCVAVWMFVQRRRRERFVNRLTDVVRALGLALGGREDAPELDTIEAGDLFLKMDGRRVRVPVGELLEVAMEEDFQRRNERLRWLVEKARARSEPG